MGRKSSAKTHAQAPPPPEEPKKSFPLVRVAALAAAVVAIGAFAYLRTSRPSGADAAPSLVTDQIAADVAAMARLGPHHQEHLPPLDLPAYGTERSPEVIRAAYTFAAEHPEVLSYVPCFCG